MGPADSHLGWGKLSQSRCERRFQFPVSLSAAGHTHATCVRDGEASSQVAQRGAGAEPGLSGQGVAVVVPLSSHRLETQDLAV